MSAPGKLGQSGRASELEGAGWSRRAALGLALGVLFGLGACFSGADLDDKEPPPGYAGGSCVEGQGCRVPALCYEGPEVCYDPTDPCEGFYCGGHGTCTIDMDNGNRPLCVCELGYSNETYAFYCTPG
ncbi:hypothetical protein G6O69_09145 [Pseudenhygromyxa sp. WMMC2535]|uniref:hypothetical protein n=1 Tax=Pseudenhygromyxa sp. WMMC2535 TaxID=2712867 RepID=UPI001555BD7D|nr:hypothetical protein [Pseudenhygromyxa sp. WMMC2535]NVB37996.1 hypothetical protein [Pseudenhygromyxa sp. WMMC2535]